jgi:hypothetical protein
VMRHAAPSRVTLSLTGQDGNALLFSDTTTLDMGPAVRNTFGDVDRDRKRRDDRLPPDEFTDTPLR